MVVTVKLVGALRHLARRSQLELKYLNGLTLEQVIKQMSLEMSGVQSTFSDRELNDSASNSLVLINGTEISVLDGFETKLCDGDEIVFVPIVHGG